MNKKYHYKAFGLHFISDFEIPELLASAEKPDVEVRIGKTPGQLNRIIQKGVRYQAGKDEFLLETDGIARFYVKNGKEIVVEPFKSRVDREVRLFLLGSAFGALFIQRGLLPIHGSAIRFGPAVSVFTGLSGVGKSSIAAWFVRQGYQILADDISVINASLQVEPGFPNMKIWKDVLGKLGIAADTLSAIRPDIQKYKYTIDENFCTEPLPVNNIFIIQPKNTPGFEYEELTGVEKFNALKNSTFRYRFVEGLQKQQEHFRGISQLLKQVKVYRVKRPQAPLMLEEFAIFLRQNFALDA
ncbi:MAG: hypothetical protein V2I54_02545 [Bacteroidales bacterium]|jgi:hypothetical protein|nr:hypothetical protein [Bacteroidales bacterium]